MAYSLGVFMQSVKADKPFYDAFSTVFGVAATFLEMYKFISGWVYWIALNVFTIWLYAVKGLWVYACLMVVYSILSVYGLRKWSLKLKEA